MLDQPRGPAAFLDPADHRHVQLHEVGLEQRQAVEARIPRAEIVDGDAEPGRPQRRHPLPRAREIAHLRRFGELQHDALRPRLQRGLSLDAALFEELERVHVEKEQLLRRQLGDGGDLDLAQDASQDRHLPAPLRRSQDVDDRSERRIHRPRQRLPGDLGAGRQVHDRLIDGVEGAFADRALQGNQLVRFMAHLRGIQTAARRQLP